METFYTVYMLFFFILFMPIYVYSYWVDVFVDDNHNKKEYNDKK